MPLDATRFTLLYAVHLFGGAAMGRSGPCRHHGPWRRRVSGSADLARAVRALALTAFSGAPATHALTGYPGPFGGRVGIAAGMIAP